MPFPMRVGVKVGVKNKDWQPRRWKTVDFL